jgi:hypothetical protein
MAATAVLSLLHVPPGVVLDKVSVAARHVAMLPVIAEGTGFTVSVWPIAHRVTGSVYSMIAVPTATPPTMPDEVMEATLTSLVVHMPPGVASLKVTVEPTQTDAGPDMGAGKGRTRITVSRKHPGMVE